MDSPFRWSGPGPEWRQRQRREGVTGTARVPATGGWCEPRPGPGEDRPRAADRTVFVPSRLGRLTPVNGLQAACAVYRGRPAKQEAAKPGGTAHGS